MTTFCLGNINPGEVRAEYMQSVLAVMREADNGATKLVQYITKTHGPYLDVGRNFIVERFLNHTDADVLLFVDSDMTFEPDDVHRIVAQATRERPVVGGLYVNWFAEFGVRPVALNWDHTGPTPQMNPIELPADGDGLLEVGCVGTGFMAIHRSVLEQMSTVYDAPCPWFAEVALHGSQMGEDVTFCQRVIALGHQVYVDTDVRLGHHKTQLFHPTGHMAAAHPKEPAHV